MTSLIACLTTGKGTWTQVIQLIAAHEWEKVILVTNSFGKEKFSINREVEYIVIGEECVEAMTTKIEAGLKKLVGGFEVAVNLVSGTGREHMAILSGVLKAGFALRLVDVKDGKVVEL